MSVAANWGGTLPVANDTLRINGACVVDNAFANNAYGTLEVSRGATGTVSWPVSGTATLNVTTVLTGSFGAGTINMTNGGTLQIRTSWKSTNTTLTPGTGTVNWNVTGAASTLPRAAIVNTYNNLTITATGRVASLGQITTVNGNLLISAGTLSVSGSNFGLTVKSNFTNNATFTQGAGTVTLRGTAAQSIGGTTTTTFNNLTISNTSAVVTANTNFSTNGNLTVNASAVLSPVAAVVVSGTGTIRGSGSVQVTRTAATADFSSQYTIANKTLTNLTVEYNGGVAQTVSALSTYGGLKINNANGVALVGTTTLSGTLTLTSGIVTTGVNTLTTSATCATSVNRTSGWINGNLKKAIPANASTCTFEVGGASVYAPITATFIAGAAAANITAKTTDGDHASIATSGLDSNLTANRSWSLSSTVAQATPFSAVFNFNAADLDTDTQPLTQFKARSFSSGAWATPTTGTLASTSTQVTGLTLAAATQKDFVVGEVAQGGATGAGGFNVVENGASATAGKVYTKLAGTAFTLDLVALNVARTAIDTAFKGVVKVELLNSSDNSVVVDANGCRSTWTVIQTLGSNPQFLTVDSGRKQNISFTENNAYTDARVRVSYPATGTATLIGCSTDNFAIRPSSITSVVSGAPVDMNNATTSGTPSAIAGSGTFTLIASTGVVGYTGTPKIDNTAVDAHAGKIQNGTVSGTFPAALTGTGTSTGTSAFTYSEVGNFRFLGYAPASDTTTARGVYDDTFTLVDQTSDCTADFSNTLSSGKYGCKFGITANSSYFGRFYPDHFDVTVNSNGTMVGACAAGGFTYTGRSMRYGTAPSLTITPMNAATGGSGVTKNYSGSFQKLAASGITIATPTADGTQNGVDGATKTALSASMTAGTLTNSSGPLTYTLNTNDTFTYTRNANALIGAYTSNIPLIVASVNDGEVSATGGTLPTLNPTGVSMRYGRLNLSNAYGSELLPLSIPVEAQYWNGTSWVTNTADSCTAFPASSIIMGNYLSNLSACKTLLSPTGTLTLSNGAINLNLSAPGSGNTGSVDLTLNIGSSVSGNTCIAATESLATATNMPWFGATNPTARATFGIYQGNRHFIYFRETY